jgi:hypothetical protein
MLDRVGSGVVESVQRPAADCRYPSTTQVDADGSVHVDLDSALLLLLDDYDAVSTKTTVCGHHA